MRVLNFTVLLLIIAASCKDEPKKETVNVGISEFSMPKTAKVNSTIQIKTQAEATSGCYHSLRLVMEKINELEYSMKAFGTFESKNGTCTANMVYKDSIFNFTPTQSGKYIFHIRDYSKILLDTLSVD